MPKKTKYPNKKNQPKDLPETDPRLVEIMGKFNAARAYTRKGFKDTWQKCRKLYNNERVMANYEGNSDTFLPEVFTINQSVKSNIVGGKIKIEILPTREDQIGDVKVANALMEQFWVADKTKLKASWGIDDSLVTGNGYLWQYWHNGRPCNRYVPTEDNFFDPDATNYENLKWGGYRYLTTLKALKDEHITNDEYEEGSEDPLKKDPRKPRYKNLNLVQSLANEKNPLDNGQDKTAKQMREEMIAGAVLSEGKYAEDLVEIIVYMDKKDMVKIANRSVIIEDDETYAKQEARIIESVDDEGIPHEVELPEIPAFIPVAPFRDYVDGAMWYARGEIEVIGELQELLNDTQNQKSDNLNYTLNRMWVLDPSQSHKKDEIQSIPGAVFTVPVGSLQPLQQQSVGADADNEMVRITSAMRRATAADELIQGAGQDMGDITATEVRAQMAQAGTRFGSKLENYESEGFAILAQNMFKLTQIYLTQEQAVRIVGAQGVEWKNYNPGEFLGDYDIKVVLDGTARVLKEEEKQNAMQFYLMSSKMPFINQEALFKMTAAKLFDKEERDLEGLIQQMPMMMPGMKGMMPPPGGMPQEGMGEMASAPMSEPERQVSEAAMQGQGMNIPGMPT